MRNRRRSDDAHDVGDSMPGTVGDSNGAIHDGRGGPTFDPNDDVAAPEGENEEHEHPQHEWEDESESELEATAESGESQASGGTRMKYAKKYGDSWPEDRQRRFLREHDVSAEEMGWKITE